MDGYPHHYVAHNLPFVVLFGLESTEINPQDEVEKTYPLLREKGIYISSDLPNVAGPPAESILSCFRDVDARDAAWNNRPGKGKVGTMGFTYRTVGRVSQTSQQTARFLSFIPKTFLVAYLSTNRPCILIVGFHLTSS